MISAMTRNSPQHKELLSLIGVPFIDKHHDIPGIMTHYYVNKTMPRLVTTSIPLIINHQVSKKSRDKFYNYKIGSFVLNFSRSKISPVSKVLKEKPSNR